MLARYVILRSFWHASIRYSCLISEVGKRPHPGGIILLNLTLVLVTTYSLLWEYIMKIIININLDSVRRDRWKLIELFDTLVNWITDRYLVGLIEIVLANVLVCWSMCWCVGRCVGRCWPTCWCVDGQSAVWTSKVLANYIHYCVVNWMKMYLGP